MPKGKGLKSSRFYFELPGELIAQYPAGKRGESRLLVYDRKKNKTAHTKVKNLTDFLDSGNLLVFNNTRVRKARLFGISQNGGKTEFLLLSELGPRSWAVLCSKSKKHHSGKVFSFPGNVKGEILKPEKGSTSEKILLFDSPVDNSYLEKYGHVPLPPYIKREDNESDSERYQTVYSRITGSCAAPTAGLHFTEDILNSIKKTGADICFITLHVGRGTFEPLRSENVEDHVMHEETYEISEETANKINTAKQCGKKIMAVGTTSLRALESSGSKGIIKPGKNSTSLFIYPGYSFRQADQLFTNFHTPDSTLMLLVSAFGGTGKIKELYSEAVRNNYRFYSYGDAMCIL